MICWFPPLVNTEIFRLSVSTSVQSVVLSWQPLLNLMPNITFEYEAAYVNVSDCVFNSVSLPNGYRVYSPRTTSNSTEVFGLMSGTCYVFGVRAYTPVTDSTGEFSVVNGVTVSDGKRLLRLPLQLFLL